jgi:hypothetical protein
MCPDFRHVLSRLLAGLFGVTLACAAQGRSTDPANSLSAYYGLRDASFGSASTGSASEGPESSGTAYGLGQRFTLTRWLQLGADFESVAFDSLSETSGDYSLERETWRAGLFPRIETGLADIGLCLVASWVDSNEQGDALSYLGTHQRFGYGIGGSSLIRLGAGLSLYGEAAGYTLDDLEIIDATMRLSYRLGRRGAPWAVFVQGGERSYSNDAGQWQERDLRMGVSLNF